jgi:hypothetical protein
MKLLSILFRILRFEVIKWRYPEIAQQIDIITIDYINSQTKFYMLYFRSDFYRCGDLRCCPIMWWQANDGFCPGKITHFPGSISFDMGSHSYRIKTLFGRHCGDN